MLGVKKDIDTSGDPVGNQVKMWSCNCSFACFDAERMRTHMINCDAMPHITGHSVRGTESDDA